MPKLDLKRSMRRLYFPPVGQPVLVDVPELSFLAIDGRGDPSISRTYREAVEALFAVSYALKFTIKRVDPEDDFTVMPLESLWWTGPAGELDLEDRARWRWTAMIAQPPVVTEELLRKASAQAARKRPLPALKKMRLERFREGLSAQIMHVGPYEEEGPTIEKLHAFIAEHDYPLRGKHHEIYLSDPRRCAPERLKTVVRQPVGL
ncbi:MAG TPA: GyrI-like domain-containing protein [Actinomycetota bacterium]|nr:GyrI-like domain-containing protein [Actinomycetota bacterium]